MATAAGERPQETESQRHWRTVRRYLNQHRSELTSAADRLYPEHPRVGSASLLCRPEWIPSEPIQLDQIELAWIPEPHLAVTGTGQAAEHVRPVQASGERYPSYAESIKDLDPPTVFEDRASYRILEVAVSGESVRLGFCAASYFDGVNIGEALAHELAATTIEQPDPDSLARLPLRRTIGDPLNLNGRVAVPAISALTLRREMATGAARFILHWRDPAKVAHAGGLYQVMPVGVFQPSSDAPWNQDNDFDLWRCMVREYAEEFLGATEDHGTDTAALDYDSWPLYRDMNQARNEGRLRVYFLGLGVDPLTLAVDLLVATVVDSDLFDELFDALVTVNAEGNVINGDAAIGTPFVADTVTRFTSGGEPMQPAGAAVLELAWRHRGTLVTPAYDRES